MKKLLFGLVALFGLSFVSCAPVATEESTDTSVETVDSVSADTVAVDTVYVDCVD